MNSLAPYALLLAILLSALGPARAAEPNTSAANATEVGCTPGERALARMVAHMAVPSLDRRLARLRQQGTAAALAGQTAELTAPAAPASLATADGANP